MRWFSCLWFDRDYCSNIDRIQHDWESSNFFCRMAALVSKISWGCNQKMRMTLICMSGPYQIPHTKTWVIWVYSFSLLSFCRATHSLSSNFSFNEFSFPKESNKDFQTEYISTSGNRMPSFDLFKYSKSPLAFSDDSLLEKPQHGQTEGLLSKEQFPDQQTHHRTQWITITLRACEMVVIFVCILMFVFGLRWQLNADQYCLELQSFYCRHFHRFRSWDAKKALNKFLSTCTKTDRQSLPLSAVQRLSDLAVAISRPSKPGNRCWMGQIGAEYVTTTSARLCASSFLLLEPKHWRLSPPLVHGGSSTLEEVLQSGGTADDVRLREELGGGYMTWFEVNHQLHCLNLIRKATHYDYYKDKTIEFTNTPKIQRLHIGDFFSPSSPSKNTFLPIGSRTLLTSREKTTA